MPLLRREGKGSGAMALSWGLPSLPLSTPASSQVASCQPATSGNSHLSSESVSLWENRTMILCPKVSWEENVEM